MGLHHLDEASEKKKYIEIWLGHSMVCFSFSPFFTPLTSLTSMKTSLLKSAASTTSLSSAVRSGSKRDTKRNGTSVDTLVRPLKRPKHALSNVSLSAVSDVDDVTTAAEEWASTKTSESQDIINVDSDIGADDDLENELGMCASN
jgi:hypothetical protein